MSSEPKGAILKAWKWIEDFAKQHDVDPGIDLGRLIDRAMKARLREICHEAGLSEEQTLYAIQDLNLYIDSDKKMRQVMKRVQQPR